MIRASRAWITIDGEKWDITINDETYATKPKRPEGLFTIIDEPRPVKQKEPNEFIQRKMKKLRGKW